MSSPTDAPSAPGRAEQAFIDAFTRLKLGKPERLPKCTVVSQNNVAKEAGCDPSALRKSRYPSLIAEIQQWVRDHPTGTTESPRQTVLRQRSRNRSLKEKYGAVKQQRDHALSLLAEADAMILDLTMEVARLHALAPASNVTPIARREPAG